MSPPRLQDGPGVWCGVPGCPFPPPGYQPPAPSPPVTHPTRPSWPPAPSPPASSEPPPMCATCHYMCVTCLSHLAPRFPLPPPSRHTHLGLLQRRLQRLHTSLRSPAPSLSRISALMGLRVMNSSSYRRHAASRESDGSQARGGPGVHTGSGLRAQGWGLRVQGSGLRG